VGGEETGHEASREAPELIWIEIGYMIGSGVLWRLRTLCPDAIIASYSDDDIYGWSNRTWAYMRGLQNYDVVFTSKPYNVNAQE